MKLSDYAALSSDRKGEVLAEMAKEALQPPNGQLRDLDARLRVLEARYEISTDQMIQKFRAGELKDTADIARWLILAKVRGG